MRQTLNLMASKTTKLAATITIHDVGTALAF